MHVIVECQVANSSTRVVYVQHVELAWVCGEKHQCTHGSSLSLLDVILSVEIKRANSIQRVLSSRPKYELGEGPNSSCKRSSYPPTCVRGI